MTNLILVFDLLEGPAVAAAIAVKLGSFLVLWPSTADLIIILLLIACNQAGRGDAHTFLRLSTVNLEALFLGDIELLAKVKIGDWLYNYARLVPLARSFLV